MFIDGDTFENLADVSYGDIYKNKRQVTPDVVQDFYNRNGGVPKIYINTDRALLLLNMVKGLSFDVEVIFHNSVISFGDKIKSVIPPNVKKVWCQNFNGTPDDIITPLPVGLERKMWFPEQRKQERIQEVSEQETEKDILVYMNFNTKTNPERERWYQYFKDKEWVYTEMIGNGSGFEHYLEMVSRSKFVLSPVGRGIDCHRNWECLYLGSVPIISNCCYNQNMFGDMNTLILKNFEDITEAILNDFKPSVNNEEKMTAEYWEKIIRGDE